MAGVMWYKTATRTFQDDANNPALFQGCGSVVYLSKNFRLDIPTPRLASHHLWSAGYVTVCPYSVLGCLECDWDPQQTKELSITEDRLLTTSKRTAWKSPDAFYKMFLRWDTEIRSERQWKHHTSRSVGLFQFNRRTASGSLIPRGMSLM